MTAGCPDTGFSMGFFFTAFATSWWIPGNRTSRAIVGTVILVVFMLLLFGIIRTLDQDLMSWGKKRWLDRNIHKELLSRLTCTGRQFMEFMGIEWGRRDTVHETQPDNEQVDHFQMSPPRSFAQASIRTDTAENSTFRPAHSTSIRPENSALHDHGNHSDPPALHDDTSILPPSHPHVDTSVLSPSDSHIDIGILPGLGSLQQIPENAQTIFHEQPITEAHPTPDDNRSPVNMHLTTSPCSAPEGMIETGVQAETHSNAFPTKAADMSDPGGQAGAAVTDTATAASISPGLRCAEEPGIVKFAEHVVEEPGELERSQSSRSSTPPPKIYAKSATADCFHHAPVPAKWTLRDGFDIEECKD